MIETVLGLFGMALWITATISIAAGVTWVVVKFFPGGDEDLKPKSQS